MRLEAPESVDEAVVLLRSSDNSRVLAGGTDLLVQLRSGRVAPELVVDIKRIAETREIRAESGGFRVGAAVAGAELGEHQALKQAWPGVVEAAELIGSTQVQGRASMGGNLCNGSPAADSVPGLIAAGAVCAVAGPSGRRDVKVEDICAGPGHTTLGPGEFVVSFFLPERPPHAGDAYLRFIPRTEMDIAVVGVGVNLSLDDAGSCVAARVSVCAVAPKPLLVPAAAEALVGTRVDDAALDALSAAARDACDPIDDKRGTREYRTKVAGVLAERTARIALARARGESVHTGGAH